MRDTLGGRGVSQSVTKYHNGVRGGGGLAKMSRDKFSLVISLVKVDKSLCQVTQGGGGGGRRNVTKCHIWGGGV